MGLPDVARVESLADFEDGIRGARFRDGGDNEFRLVLPDVGQPVLQRFVPHRYTDKFTGDHHAYVNREDTPLSWDQAAQLVDGMERLHSDEQFDDYFVLVHELARRAYADDSWCDDPEVKALLHSTSDQMFPPALGDRLVTLETRACDGDSPLHVLLWRRDVAGARKLIDAGMAVNVAGDMDDTPLHVALRLGSADAVAMLLAAGADPDVYNCFGDTPRASAYKRGGAVADCFRAAGFEPPPPSLPPVDAPE